MADDALPQSSLVAEIVTTGTEILLGEIVDTNAAWIAQQLREAGVNLYYKTTVGDNLARIRGVIEAGIARSDVIIVTGGLGPTVDDVTRHAIAEATRRPLQEHPAALAQLEERFRRFGSKMTENNKQQALIPEGATVIENPVGTAPGFIAEANGCSVISLPGVPREMKQLMNDTVLPWLRARAGGAIIRRRVLRTMGIGESTIDSIVDDLMRQSNPTVGLAAHTGQADIRIAARAESAQAAEAMLDELETDIRARLGQYIYSTTPDERYESVVAQHLRAHGLSVALLETNSAGNVALRLSSALADFDPVRKHLLASDDTLPESLRAVVQQASLPAEDVVRKAADALLRMSGADINVVLLGTSGVNEGVYGAVAGETWLAEADREATHAARLPYGGTEEFTVVRIGNYALRMIDDAVTALVEEIGGAPAKPWQSRTA